MHFVNSKLDSGKVILQEYFFKVSKISLIIFSGIVAEIPRALVTTFELGKTGAISGFMIFMILVLLVATIMFIVFMERALRKILINYPKRQMGNKMYGGESSHLPLKINQAGVIQLYLHQHYYYCL